MAPKSHFVANSRRFRLFVSIACVLLACTVCRAGEDKSKDEKWLQLFNGKDLTGWTPKIQGHDLGDNNGDTFRVEDGILKVCYDQYDTFDGQFGHLFYKDTFKNYRLRVEYRFVGEQLAGGAGWAFRNSGLMIHGQSAESMAKDQDFPVSIEVQLLGGKETGKRPTGNLCTPGTHVVRDGKLYTPHVWNSSSETYRGDQWVKASVEVRGNTITHFVEGKPVLVYTDPQLDEKDKDAQKLIEAGQAKMLTSGTISLQSESHPVEFRKVELLKLED
jgi:3-keto-disaccharide hydrolase